MSISSEITRISQNVSDSLTAVASKGATVPSGANSDDLPDLIASLPSTHSVTYNLTSGVTASITPAKAIAGQGLSLKLTAPTGYSLTGVTVTMGGVNITESVFEYDEAGGGGGGGSVTVTEEANATGITCVITTGSEPTPEPTPGDIPLNTELVDYTAVRTGYYVDDLANGAIVAGESWNCVTDYIQIDPSMTFSFVCSAWYGVGFYDSSKTPIRGITSNDLGTVSNDYVHGTITQSVIPSNAVYCVLTGNPYALNSNYLSLIRTA